MSLTQFQQSLRQLWKQAHTALARRPLAFYAVLTLLFYALAISIDLSRYEWNPTTLFHFGHYYVAQNEALTPAGSVRFIGNERYGGNGYDGQIFFYYARSLFSPGLWPQGFSMAYRAPRIGLPLLAAPFNALGAWGLVAGFYIVQIGLILWAVKSLYRLLLPVKRYLILFFILSPFMLRSTLLMVSDITALCLCVIGYSAWRSSQEGVRSLLSLFWAWLCFSLAIFAKESALFFLFPLGLEAIFGENFAFASFGMTSSGKASFGHANRNEKKKENLLYKMFPNLRIERALAVLLALMPMLFWQYYLRSAHGMVPANILKIFIAPFDGILGVLRELQSLMGRGLSLRTLFVQLSRLSARLLLVFLLGAALYAAVRGPFRRGWSFRLMVLFTSLSIIFADHFYFWGIFDNIARMFAMLMPALVLLGGLVEPANKDVPGGPPARSPLTPFFAGSMLLCGMLLVRAAFLTPVFPYDIWQPYTGPSHQPDAEGPYVLRNGS